MSAALVLVAVVIVAGALFVRSGLARTGAVGPLPVDILALGTKVVPASPDGKVSLDVAMQAADQQWDIEGLKSSAYLVQLTDPTNLGGIVDRPFWIIRVDGVIDPGSHPIGLHGPASGLESPTTLYIYIDAITGEWVMAHN